MRNEASKPLPSTTLDSVVTEIEHWRNNKDQRKGRCIPDEIWSNIFSLEAKHPAKVLRSVFRLNTVQYKTKRAQLCKSLDKEESEIAAASSQDKSSHKDETTHQELFCEVKLDSNASAPSIQSLTEAPRHATKASLATLRSNNMEPAKYLDPTTLIVECIHPDGHRLKIHATTKSLQELFQVFYQMEHPVQEKTV